VDQVHTLLISPAHPFGAPFDRLREVRTRAVALCGVPRLLPLGRCGAEIISVCYVPTTRCHFHNSHATVPEPCRPSGLRGFGSVPAYLEIVR
jgi:hypothetical protein